MPSATETRLTQAWQRRGPLACALWPLSLLFGALAALRRALYRVGILKAERLPVPVIIVGNIAIGGTGKTPFTLWLIEALRAAGYRPGVISRGYGGSGEGIREVTPASRAADCGDEPLLIALRSGAPVVVGRDRPSAGRALLAAHPEVNVLISDDGLQHYALQRDLEIVLRDARGEGNGWLLPAGPLREPASRRRDFTVHNGAGEAGGAARMTLAGQHAVALADPADRLPLSALRGRKILAAAGIGHPPRFFAMLEAAGLAIEPLALPDHYDYVQDPFAGKAADCILVTEKDAVKCRHIAALAADARLRYVPVDAHIAGPLAELIVEKLRGYPPA